MEGAIRQKLSCVLPSDRSGLKTFGSQALAKLAIVGETQRISPDDGSFATSVSMEVQQTEMRATKIASITGLQDCFPKLNIPEWQFEPVKLDSIPVQSQALNATEPSIVRSHAINTTEPAIEFTISSIEMLNLENEDELAPADSVSQAAGSDHCDSNLVEPCLISVCYNKR